MYFEHDSFMYNQNKLWIKNLLSTVVPNFYAMCSKDLDAIIPSHDKYYYRPQKKQFLKNLFLILIIMVFSEIMIIRA